MLTAKEADEISNRSQTERTIRKAAEDGGILVNLNYPTIELARSWHETLTKLGYACAKIHGKTDAKHYQYYTFAVTWTGANCGCD